MAGMEQVAGLLLTGGASRRMGRDKASLTLAGRTCAELAAAALRDGLDGPVLEVGPGRSPLASVSEDRPGSGPLAALAAGTAALTTMGHYGAVVLLACDMPFVTSELVAFLAAGLGTAVPLVGGRAQPLCARYGAGSGPVAARLVASGARSLQALLDRLDVTWLDEAAWRAVASARTFADVDTPADLAALGLVAG